MPLTQLGGRASIALAFSTMSSTLSPSGHSNVCPSCGLRQDPRQRECSRCGHPLGTPGLIYRREADGTWSIVRDIDLSSLAPKPVSAPKRRVSRQSIALILALGVAGAALAFGSWRLRVAADRQVGNEIQLYLTHSVGSIEPRFTVQYRLTEQAQLRVAGQTNLPDGTNLQVEVHAGDLLVAVDFPVIVSRGGFQTRALLQRGKPFTLPAYQARLSATFDRGSQAPSVLLVVGENGQRLQGPLIHRVDAASGAKLSYVEDFSLSR